MISKKQNLKNGFSKIRPKMPMGRVATKIFGVSECLYRKFVKKNFSRLGTPKIDNSGPFFKNRCPKFLPTGKKRIFRVADFFEKSWLWVFIFIWGMHPSFFSQNLRCSLTLQGYFHFQDRAVLGAAFNFSSIVCKN